MKKIFDIKVGDQVWLMHGNSAVCATVIKAFYTKYISCVDHESIIESERFTLSLDGKQLYESYEKKQLFATKADLINSL